MSVPPLVPLDEQVGRVVAASRLLACEVVLLGLSVQLAWFEAWTRPLLDAAEVGTAGLARRARRDRLMRRGVPAHLAGQALRLVPRRSPGPGQPP